MSPPRCSFTRCRGGYQGTKSRISPAPPRTPTHHRGPLHLSIVYSDTPWEFTGGVCEVACCSRGSQDGVGAGAGGPWSGAGGHRRGGRADHQHGSSRTWGAFVGVAVGAAVDIGVQDWRVLGWGLSRDSVGTQWRLGWGLGWGQKGHEATDRRTFLWLRK
jgi:hypothetical protein